MTDREPAAPSAAEPAPLPTGAQHCSADVRLTMLSRTPLFRGLDPGALGAVNERFRSVGLKAGEVVFRSGDPATSLYVVASGQVKLLDHTADGRQVLFDLCVPGEFFGGAPALGDDLHLHDAVAAGAGCALTLGAEAFAGVLREWPRVALNALELTTARLRDARRTVQGLSTLPVEAQVAATLLRLDAKLGRVEAGGSRLEAALTQIDLAAMSGTTPESVNRVLGNLRRRGLVESGRGWFLLRDRAALARLAAPE